jgi:hypothetical protein
MPGGYRLVGSGQRSAAGGQEGRSMALASLLPLHWLRSSVVGRRSSVVGRRSSLTVGTLWRTDTCFSQTVQGHYCQRGYAYDHYRRCS